MHCLHLNAFSAQTFHVRVGSSDHDENNPITGLILAVVRDELEDSELPWDRPLASELGEVDGCRAGRPSSWLLDFLLSAILLASSEGGVFLFIFIRSHRC